jgi:hypothetical protein
MDKNTIFAVTLLVIILVISGLFQIVYSKRSTTLLDQFTNSVRSMFYTRLPETNSSKKLTDAFTSYSDKLPHKLNPRDESIGIWTNDETTATYVKGNIPCELDNNAKAVISETLNDFNNRTQYRLKFLEIDTLVERHFTDKVGDHPSVRYLCEFFSHEVDTKSTRKLVMQWEQTTCEKGVKPVGSPKVHFLHAESADLPVYSELNRLFVHSIDSDLVEKPANKLDIQQDFKLAPHPSINAPVDVDGVPSLDQLYEKIEPCENADTLVESAICRNALKVGDWHDVPSQEPCREEAIPGVWDRYGVYEQRPRAESCKDRHSGYTPVNPDLFDHPTLYSIPMVGEYSISLNRRAPEVQNIYAYKK